MFTTSTSLLHAIYIKITTEDSVLRFDRFDVTDLNSVSRGAKVLGWPLSRLLLHLQLHLEGRTVGIPQRSEQKTRTLACVEVCHWRGVCSSVSRRR